MTAPARDLAWAVEQAKHAASIVGAQPNWRMIDADALRLLLGAAEDAQRLDALERRAMVVWLGGQHDGDGGIRIDAKALRSPGLREAIDEAMRP